jgi:hypothetical protein
MLPLRPAGRRRAQYAACIQVRHGKLDSEHADIDAALNMAPADQETEVAPPVEEPEEMPLPSDPKVIFLGGLFVLALLATAYVASEIVLPLVFAIISISCCSQPCAYWSGFTYRGCSRRCC